MFRCLHIHTLMFQYLKHKIPSPANNLVVRELKNNSLFNPTEQIADIWQQVLGVSSTPLPGDHFFRMGGNSLTSIEFVQEVKKRLNLTLSSIILYEFPMFGDLLNHILNHVNKKQNHQIQEDEDLNEYYSEL